MRLSYFLKALKSGTLHSRRVRKSVCATTLLATLFGGCAHSPRQWEKTVGNRTNEINSITAEMDNPSPPVFQEASMTSSPITAKVISDSVEYDDKSLNEILLQALQNAPALRDLGGVILRNPESVKTGYTSRIQEADPRFGMEAALSAFDAQLGASAMFNNNDRLYNNAFFAGGATAFQQDLNDYQVELSKRSATGALMALRGVTNYDSNNAPANTFPSAWNSWVEGEVRQPLLQGGGLEFNRIAGPGSSPGLYNGILIAKANADINQHDFTIALTDFVSNVENGYWDLYTAYRELDARKKAMEQALVVWNKAKATTGTDVGVGNEALARQQYYQLKAEVDEALSGRLLSGTQTRNGSSGGTAQAGGGVLSAERRLRLLCGMPAADGRLIRPSEEPTSAEIIPDWESSLQEALTLRPEIQKQHITLKKREMELLAAQNFLNPRLDAVGRYRFRGMGDDLIAGGTQNGGTPASSLGNLGTGDYQEWMMGVEMTVPIGYRKGHAAVNHAELMIARERIMLKEQQREIVSNLNGATADVVRAYQAIQNNLNQYLAANDYFQSLVKPSDQLDVAPDKILDAQRRVVQAEIQFFRSRAEYAIALKNFQYEKGALLAYKDLRLIGDSLPVEMPDESERRGEKPESEVPASPGEDNSAADNAAVEESPVEEHSKESDKDDSPALGEFTPL